MSVTIAIYRVKPDAPEDVIYHDVEISPWVVDEPLILDERYDDFELWCRICIQTLLLDFKGAVVGLTDIQTLEAWMDDYHTNRPLEYEDYPFWKYVNYTRESLPKDAQGDTPEYRANVLEFMRESVGYGLIGRLWDD